MNSIILTPDLGRKAWAGRAISRGSYTIEPRNESPLPCMGRRAAARGRQPARYAA
ncbi:hypothetical protein [Azorhizobium sp. AG788]|uniref:hypothetical protein n=1 Tax=Azorhizobium sp. AG788 TaxID=2183897 RepID=UPI003138960A